MKRADSSELLSVSSPSKRNWTPPQKLANSDLSQSGESGILCKKISRVDSMTRSDKLRNIDTDSKSNSDLSQINMRNMGGKLYKSKRKMRALSNNIPLNQQQLTSYMNLLQLNSTQIEDMLKDLGGNDDNMKAQQAASISKKTDLNRPPRKFGIAESSEISTISDDDNEKFDKKTRSSSLHESLTNVSNFLACGKKTLSQSETSSTFNSPVKSDESGYGSDSTRTDIESPGFSFKSSRINSMKDRRLFTTDLNSVSDYSTQKDASKNYLSDDTDTDVETDTQTTLKIKHTLNKWSPEPQQQFVATESIPLSHELDYAVTDLTDNHNQKSPNSDFKLLVEDYNKALDELTLEFKPSNVISTEPLKYKESAQQPIFNKEFKCIRLKADDNEDVGITIVPEASRNGISAPYVITDIAPNSAAER